MGIFAMNRKQNVTKQMATDAARNGMHETGRQAVIWYDNPRDGWRWDYIDDINWRHKDWHQRTMLRV
jgi:hypothetical protein